MWGFYYAIIRTPVKQPGFSRKYPDPAFFFRVAQMEYIKTVKIFLMSPFIQIDMTCRYQPFANLRWLKVRPPGRHLQVEKMKRPVPLA